MARMGTASRVSGPGYRPSDVPARLNGEGMPDSALVRLMAMGNAERIVRLAFRLTWFILAVVPGQLLMMVHELACRSLDRPFRRYPVLAYRLGGLGLIVLGSYTVSLLNAAVGGGSP
jgi:hypothetical protein